MDTIMIIAAVLLSVLAAAWWQGKRITRERGRAHNRKIMRQIVASLDKITASITNLIAEMELAKKRGDEFVRVWHQTQPPAPGDGNRRQAEAAGLPTPGNRTD